MGAAAIGLVRVADGIADLYYERHLNGWDMLAGALIAHEAGADVYMPTIDASLGDGGPIIAAAAGLKDQFAFLRQIVGASWAKQRTKAGLHERLSAFPSSRRRRDAAALGRAHGADRCRARPGAGAQACIAREQGRQTPRVGIGAGVAVLLQSSTAVAILAAGFAGSGTITLVTGLALMLGADFGSSQDLPRLKQAMFLTAASDSQQGLRRDLGPLAGVEAPIPC